MVDFKYYLSADHFKIGHYGDKHVKRINMALFVSGIVIIVTLFFYILMYSFTNFSSLDNLEEYSTEFTKNDKDIMSNVVLSAKIMPSYNFKENAVWLEPTRDVSSKYKYKYF